MSALGVSNDIDGDGGVLLVNVCNSQLVGSVHLGAIKSKADGLVCVTRGLRGDSESLEGGKRDGVEVRAAAGDDEALDGSEGKVAVAGGQERELGGDLAEDEAVEAVLLAFLAQY